MYVLFFFSLLSSSDRNDPFIAAAIKIVKRATEYGESPTNYFAEKAGAGGYV
jgi:hypothetical protein